MKKPLIIFALLLILSTSSCGEPQSLSSEEKAIEVLQEADQDSADTIHVTTGNSSDRTDITTMYTDDQLRKMALEYYGEKSGENTESLQAATADNVDGTVSIQIYQNLGDHNSTAAWYTVDPATGIGKDQVGNMIDLKK